MSLARLAEESFERYGEYESLAFEGRACSRIGISIEPRRAWRTRSRDSGSSLAIA